MAVCDNFISLRYFNVYGPGENKKGKMASVVFQSYTEGNFKLFPKNPKRDFVYVDDVVSANIHAIDSPKGIYEVGSGEARTFEDVLDNLEILFTYRNEVDIPDGYQYYTESDSERWVPGWKPKYNIETGIEEYKKYFKERNFLD